MADPAPPKPSQPYPGVDRRALASARDRRVATSEFVDILTSRPGPHGPAFEVRWELDVTSLARPGTGGRQPSTTRSFEIEATRAVRDWLGEPTDHTFRGALLHVWEIPDGDDGIIAARLSGQDVQNHETVFGQVHGLLEICERRALKPRYLIASMRNSGMLDYERRLDFAFIRERVLAGDCSWVAYFKADRIARQILSANLFYRFLQDTGTGLFLEEIGREVDWKNESDMLILNTLGTIGQFEGGRIKARTHGPLVRRWLATGRGYPGAKRMGFKRDAGDWVVVDPVQWPHIKFAHMTFAASGENGGTSVRNLRDTLEGRGFKVSRDKLRKILHDEIYVTGDWSVTYEGVVYPGRTIKLEDPVPREVFDRNQQLMEVNRGRQRVNPIGHYALNRLLVTHTACRHIVDSDGAPPLLRATSGAYKHKCCPQPECSGFSVPHEVLDAIVMRTLLELCESPDLQAEFEQRAERAVEDGYDDAGRAQTRRNRLRVLEQQEARIRREWLEEGVASGHLDPALRAEALADIRQDITACQRQLEYAELKEKRALDRAALGEQSEVLLERARQVLTPAAPADPDLAQRRAAFVRRAISEVRVGDGEVTLYGPLIPEGGILISGNPLEHAGDVLLEQLASKSALRSQLGWRRRDRGCDPPVAWKSRPLLLPDPRRAPRDWRALDWDACLEALRRMDELEPPGRLACRQMDARYRAIFGDADAGRLTRSVRAHGATMAAAWCAAIGSEASLARGRRPFATEADFSYSIACAVDAGVRFGPGWFARWNAFAETERWVGDANTMLRRVRTLRLDLDRVIGGALRAAGAPPAAVDGWRRGLDDRPEMLRATLVEADAKLPVGRRLTADAIDQALHGDAWAAPAEDLQRVCRTRHLDWGGAIRDALGVRRAVVRGRVSPSNAEEWRMIAGLAVEHGLAADARWRTEWRALQHDGVPLPGATRFVHAVGGLAAATRLVYEAAGVDTAWIPVRLRPGEHGLEDVVRVFRAASSELPRGPIPARRLQRVVTGRADLMSWYAINDVLRRGRLALPTVWRLALGTDVALRLGRVAVRDAEELRLAVGAALDAGVRLRPGWNRDWDGVAEAGSWIPSYRCASQMARRYGASLHEMARELSDQRGLPAEAMPRRGPRRRRVVA
jgi:hypothetical protein